MNPVLRRMAVSALIALMLLVIPVAATRALTEVSYSPNAPLVTGRQQQVTANYYTGASGSATFIRSHMLQMQTDLVNARWNIQVIVDGRNAAQQSASGSAAFVNGALLSYPEYNDVSLEVTVDGVVPPVQHDQVMVLQVEEINNSGGVVPGSIITLTQPMAGQPAAAVQTAVPTLAPPGVPPSPTTSAGFLTISGVLAISLVFFFLVKGSR